MIKKLLISILLFSQISFADHLTLEPLIGHFSTQGGVHIQVYSGGCTYKKQFDAKVEMKGDVRVLSFSRRIQDPCRAYLPYGEILSFSFEELGLKGGDRFEIANPRTAGRVSRM